MSIKKILYRCCGAVLTMALLCGCGAQSDNISSAEESAKAGTEARDLSEVDITLLSDDVSEVSVNKVKDAWSRLSQVAILPDYEIAIGPSSRHEQSDGLINFTELEIASDDFEVIFTDKCTDLPYWKTVGLSECAFGYEPVNAEDQVKEYLEAREEKTFPLFALFFYEKYSEDSDIQMSKDCAYYLTKYALDKYSYNDFAENEYRAEWLMMIDSDKEFRFDDVDKAVEAATAQKQGTAIYVECEGNTWEIHEVEWLKTADDVYSMLYDAEDGIRKLCKRIAAESSVVDEASFRKNVKIIPTDKSDKSTSRDGVIVLKHPLSIIHEYVHCTLSYSPEECWLVEGLAEYYTADYYDEYVYRHNVWDDVYQSWYDEGIIPDEYMALIEQDGALEYEEAKIDYYQKFREKDSDKHNQYSCLSYAIGITDLIYYGTELRENARQRTVREIYKGNGTNNKLGNYLIYESAMVVTADLIAEYGVDSIISSKGSFEEDFGVTSNEYIQNYIDNKLFMHFIEE